MAEKAPHGQTAFYLTKEVYKVFRPGKTLKEHKNGKWARCIYNKQVSAERNK